MRFFFSFLVLFCSLVGQAEAFLGPNCDIHWKAYRLPAQEGSASAAPVNARAKILLALTVVPPSDQYLYGPGSTEGLPTKMTVSYAVLDAFPMQKMTAKDIDALLGEKSVSLVVRTPEPVSKSNTVFASVILPGSESSNPLIYPGPITFWVEAPASVSGLGGLAIKASLSGLLCSASSCTPASGELGFTLSATELAALPSVTQEPWWTAWNDGENIFIPPPDDIPSQAFFPPDPVSPATADDKGIAGVDAPPSYADVFASLQPMFFLPALEVEFLGEALLYGLLAGLLLNLMPCVLPVVSLKFSALLAVSSMTDKKSQARAFRGHCLIFALGIMTWFLVLAFLLGGAGWAWGELFQQPVVIVLLGLMLFVLGLSLFGVYSLPILDLKVGSDKHPYCQAYVSGLLATLLATPCSGPLLGGVLAWAIRQPLPVLTLAVTCVGVGMALPYVVMAFCPRLVHLLPRPGTWTLRLEQLLGFFLMGSVLYLTTLLPPDWIPAFLFNLFAIAFGAWLWGQIGHLRASRLRRGISRALAVSVVLLSVWWGSASIQADSTWEPFDAQMFSSILGAEPILMEFTADWCPSCKALEHTTLNKNRMADLRRRYKIRTIRVDLTRDAEAGKELLKALDSTSIPVIAMFPKGENARQPMVLRDLVTPTQLEEAVSAVFEQSGFEKLKGILSVTQKH